MTPANVRAALVRKALSERGYVERGGSTGRNGNITKFWDVVCKANQGQPWCGGFVAWDVYSVTGVKLWNYFNSFYTPDIVAYAKKVGAWKTSNPLPGDWCLMNFPGGNFVDHVGVTVVGRTNCEGNTSPGNAGSQSNGGGVYVRVRPSSVIVGWVDIIKLLAAVGFKCEALKPIKTAVRGPFPLPKSHWYGPDDGTAQSHSGKQIKDKVGVREIQQEVGVEADEDFGPGTAAAVKSWQKAHGLSADGEVGYATWNAMLKA